MTFDSTGWNGGAFTLLHNDRCVSPDPTHTAFPTMIGSKSNSRYGRKNESLTKAPVTYIEKCAENPESIPMTLPWTLDLGQ